MEKIKNNIKKVLESDNLPYFIFFIILVLFHLCIKGFVGDDRDYFGKILSSGMSIQDYVKERYIWWSSRIIIELFIILLAKYQLVIWKFLDIAIYILLAKSISKISLSKNNKFVNYFICIMLLLLPIPVLNSAGWICTSLNYLWVAALSIFSISIIYDYIIEKNIPIWKYVLYLLAEIYACNQEQMVVVMFCVLGSYILYEILKHSIKYIFNNRKMIIVMFLITIISLIFILTCPGNQQRKFEETEKWFPEHKSFNLIEKVELGLTSTVGKLVLETNTLFIIFTIVIFVIVCLNEKSKIYKFISSLLVLMGCGYTVFINYIVGIAPNIESVIERFKSEQLIIRLNQINVIDFCIIIGYALLLFLIPICFYIIFKKSAKFLIVTGIYFLGVITRFIMAFSPTIFISGERTFTFLYMAFIICSCFVLNQYNVKNK